MVRVEAETNRFKQFLGRLIRIVYRDGTETVAKVGNLIAADDQFLEFETFQHRYIVRVSEVLKVQDAGGSR